MALFGVGFLVGRGARYKLDHRIRLLLIFSVFIVNRAHFLPQFGYRPASQGVHFLLPHRLTELLIHFRRGNPYRASPASSFIPHLFDTAIGSSDQSIHYIIRQASSILRQKVIVRKPWRSGTRPNMFHRQRLIPLQIRRVLLPEDFFLLIKFGFQTLLDLNAVALELPAVLIIQVYSLLLFVLIELHLRPE